MSKITNLLAGRSVLITGASRGIGRATALILSENGAKVAINDTNEKLLKELDEKIKEKGQECIIVPGDISNFAVSNKIVSEVIKCFGKIDVLVNNAGITKRVLFEHLTLTDWERVLSVNLTGTMLCCQAVIPYMKEVKYGKIVNVSSTAAKRPNLSTSPCYGASKAGILYLTKHLAKELAHYNIYVNAVCPGPIVTGMTNDWSPEYRRQVISNVPLGRLGKPNDVANVILFLCSNLSDFITGEAINVNGGALMD